MMLEAMVSKIHRATITETNIKYIGSITIDEDLMELSGLFEYQKVHVLNINNGERFSTYVIKGKRGSRVICLNGAAARKAVSGDKVIILAYGMLDEKEIKTFKPTIVIVDEENNPII